MKRCKKPVALMLAAFMMFALAPLAGAWTTTVKEVKVTNYNQFDSRTAYDPTNSNVSKTYVVIQAPYDQIARSSADVQRPVGAHYKVAIALSKSLSSDERIFIENTNGYSGEITADGSAYPAGRYDASTATINTTFTPARGGNTNTITLQIKDISKNNGEIYSHNITIYYIDSDPAALKTSDKTGKFDLHMNVSAAGSAANYNAYTDNNTLYIEYQKGAFASGSRLNLNFTFTDQDGYRLPGANHDGYIYSVASNGSTPFIYPSEYNRTGSVQKGKVQNNNITLPITFDTTNSSFNIGLETSDSYYTSSKLRIAWRERTDLSGSAALTVTPSRAPTLSIGQEYTFSIKESGNYYLEVVGTSGVVTSVTGKKLTIRAVSAGGAWLNVRDSDGAVVDRIYATVLSSTPESSPAAKYVMKVSSYVYSGPSTALSRLGMLKKDEIVSVRKFSGNFAVVEWKQTGIGYIPSIALKLAETPAPAPSVSSSEPASPATFEPSTHAEGTPNILIPAGGMGFKFREDTPIYRGPGKHFSQIGSAVKGSAVLAVSVDRNNWVTVQWNGEIGYVPLGILVK